MMLRRKVVHWLVPGCYFCSVSAGNMKFFFEAQKYRVDRNFEISAEISAIFAEISVIVQKMSIKFGQNWWK